ncbi:MULTISPECIES: hypothetical protein [Bradyrhizobium]|uniref:Uncharacterized protein n=1 Tax=Bradyrhizobium frederickii TaxID=2560054 RepID=A0A4Y9NTD2_9BRAD|nr:MULTISPECIES: hypothetical protein [Bradyrhizobium]RTE88350.1 hypothetical protein D6B98_36465 [Bradyrhizobium sp. LVM 105]TFV30331.1 hypothetical protein E4K66_35675 [Bradyrhizobium frederickii]TFV70206.1 hypothetical protein E4K64_30570 [Bradyrhizobium frederickii]
MAHKPGYERNWVKLGKHAYPFQIARMERLRELLAINSASPVILAEIAPVPEPAENHRGKTLSRPAQQAIEQGTIEGPDAEAGRESRTLAEDGLDLEARGASKIVLEQSEDLDRLTVQTIRLPASSEIVRRSPPQNR